MSQMQPNQPNQNQLVNAERKPVVLRLLPREWRESVSFFYMFFSEGLKGNSGIAARLAYYQRKEGLTLEEAKEAMERCMASGKAATLDYGGNQLLAALSAEVHDLVQERRKRERAEEQRRDAAQREANRVSPEEVRKTIRTIGEMMIDRATVPQQDPTAASRNNDFAKSAR